MKVVQDIFEDFIKLNFRCPKGKFVPDSFACGETPAEAKKNYKAYQKEKKQAQQDKKTTRGAVKSAKTAKQKIKKVTDPALKEKVTQVKDLIAKVTLEKKSGKVSKETYKALKAAVKELKSKKSGSEQKVVPESKQVVQKVIPESKQVVQKVIPESKQVAQRVEKPSKVVNSDLAVDTMKSGETWNAGLMGDIKVEEVDDENDTVTVTANNFTETMTKGALKKVLKEYNVTKKDSTKPVPKLNPSKNSSDKIGAMQKNYPGLSGLRNLIISGGGPDKFLEDADIPRLDQSDRSEMNMHSMKIQKDNDEEGQFEYDEDPIKTFGDISFHKMGPNKTDIAIIAGGKHFVGYVYGYDEGDDNKGVDAVISDEFRGMGGFGKRALLEYFNMNPDKITDVGGLTPNGYKAYIKMLKSIETGDLPEDDISNEEKGKIKEALKYVDSNINKGPIMGAKMLKDKIENVSVGKTVFKQGDTFGYDKSNPNYVINGIDKEKVYFTPNYSGVINTMSIKDFGSRIKMGWFGKRVGNIGGNN